MLGNHDVDRPATRYGGGEVGVARARAAALVQLSLPGAVYLYNGEELGLPNVDLPDEVAAGPDLGAQRAHRARSRRRAGAAAVVGRRAAVRIHHRAEHLAAAARRTGPPDGGGRRRDPGSTLSMFRRGDPAADADLLGGGFEWAQAPVNVLAYRRGERDGVSERSGQDVALPPGEVLVASGPLPCAPGHGGCCADWPTRARKRCVNAYPGVSVRRGGGRPV